MSGDGSNLIAVLGGEVSELIEPLLAASNDPIDIATLASRAGWLLDTPANISTDALADARAAIRAAVDALADGELETSDLDGIAAAFAAIGTAFTAVRDLRATISAGFSAQVDDATLETLASDLLNLLILRFLDRRVPAVAQVMRLLTLIETEDAPPITSGIAELRGDMERSVLRLSNLLPLLTAPAEHLRSAYLPSGFADEAATRGFVTRLFTPVRALAMALGGETYVGLEGATPAEIADPANAAALRTASIRLPLPTLDSPVRGTVGLVVTALPGGVPARVGPAGPALELIPSALASYSVTFGDRLFDVVVMGTPGVVFISDTQAVMEDGAAGMDVSLTLTKDGGGGPAILIGADAGTRLEIGRIVASAELTLSGAAPDWGVGIGFESAALIVAPADADSFLAALLGDGFEVDLDAQLRWTMQKGLHLEGSAGLTKRFAVNRSIGPITITGAALDIEPAADETAVVASGDFVATLGPFTVSVAGTGLEIELSFPEAGGNLGPVDLSLGFAPPTGLGLSIDEESISGGGFIEFDPDRGRYSGALSLDIVEVGIDAIVVVDTQLPGAADGWALFATLAAAFPSIPLGFGFTLNGVGGLIALNRTMDAEALAAGLRSGVIDSLLFPEDPIGDAATIIAQIDEYFPLLEGNTVVGPILEVGWGRPALITAELGVVISLPDGVIAVMGSLEALLPTPDAPLITLHMDALGVVDLCAGTFSLTASLYDSRLLETIDLSGDMATYLQTAPQPFFLLAVGGFHPGFEPPSVVPASMHDLRRMQARISIAADVSVAVKAYFALTSNSVQFGASVSVEASVDVWPATYTAVGWFGFDVLLVFSPFRIVAAMSAGVGIYSGKKELMGVQLAFLLEGPKPWFATGQASFRFFGIKVAFELEVGGKAAGEPKPIAHPRADILHALGSPASWSEVAPADGLAAGITYSAVESEDGDAVWVRPDHQLAARQSVAPLNRRLEIVGQAVPAVGEELMTVTGAGLAGVDLDADWELTADWFAPAQFEALGRTEKLSRASFEQMTAGVTFGAPGVAITSDPDTLGTSVMLAYEEGTLEESVRTGAAGMGLRHRATLPAEPLFTIASTPYTVVQAEDGVAAAAAPRDGAGAVIGVSQYEAMQARDRAVAADDGDAARLVVVPVASALEAAS